MLTHVLKHTAAVLLILISTSLAQAQTGGADGDEISIFIGSMLPNQIDGITEILPLFGGRYGIRTGAFSTLEFGLSNSHAEGVDFTTLTGSFRADLPAIDQFMGIIYAGIDVNWYRPIRESDRRSEAGLHVGSGLMMHVSDTFWLRSDLKFSASPGTSLSLLIGFVFKTN